MQAFERQFGESAQAPPKTKGESSSNHKRATFDRMSHVETRMRGILGRLDALGVASQFPGGPPASSTQGSQISVVSPPTDDISRIISTVKQLFEALRSLEEKVAHFQQVTNTQFTSLHEALIPKKEN